MCSRATSSALIHARTLPAFGASAARCARAMPAVAARAAIAAVAGRPFVLAAAPADLEWFHLVRLGARVDVTSIYPFLAFLEMGAVALDRCSQVARADPLALWGAMDTWARKRGVAHPTPSNDNLPSTTWF